MQRARASVPPDAIRIEDEVWQEAFSERPRSRRRLHSLEGGRSTDRASGAGGRPTGSTVARRVSGPAAPRPSSPPRASRPASTRAIAHPFDGFDLSELTSSESPGAELAPAMRPAPEPPARTDPPVGPADPSGRRTVTITGRGAERNLPWHTDDSRRRPGKPVHERSGFKPDRFAMWALFLGLLLVLVAATSAHA